MTALWAAFAWGVAEASFFFVIPDVLLTLIALFSAREAFLACGAALAGALLGGGVLHALSARQPERMHRFVASVPFVRPYMWTHVRRDLETLRWRAIRKGPLRGIPYKLYAVDAPCCLSLSVFLLASIPGRLERFLLLTAIASLPGWAFHNWIYHHPIAAAAILLAVWSAFYARYWSALSARRLTVD
jgi:membrane protein YqaA with SNARE-associated domain